MGSVSLSFPQLLLGARQFEALPCGALHWPAERLLLVADLHLEKGSALARRGWMLPPHDSLATLQRLEEALEATGARRVAALGDSFHDKGGPARLPADAAALLARLMRRADWLWITGNHDYDSAGQLGGTALTELELNGLWLRHEAAPQFAGAEISGHFHPKVRVPLPGRRVSRRCFARAGTRMVLPAYGAFAGGLWVDDPAFAAALGAPPEALVPLAQGLIRVPPTARGLAA